MLHATILPGGELSGSASITELQEALIGLAKVTGNTKINPKTTSGTVGDSTIAAVGSAAALIQTHAPDKVPDWVWGSLNNIGLLLRAMEVGAEVIPGIDESDVADIRAAIVSSIEYSASYLTLGAKAATVAISIGGGASSPGGMTAEDFMRKTPSGRKMDAYGYYVGERSSYPARTVQAFDPKKNKWLVAVPVGTELSGLGTAPSGDQYRIVEESIERKTAVAIIPLDQLMQYLKPPWYKSLWFWGGLTLIGVGGYAGYRYIKRRA